MEKIKLPANVAAILKKFRQNGFQIYAVGGAVRDILRGKKVKDWDFTTDAWPKQILSLFKKGFYDNVFGTVGMPQKDGKIFEITTFRSEKGYSDRRHPDKITWGKTLKEDLSRRDFTINAIAFDGQKFIDPFKGEEDLKEKNIKAVGDPTARFSEDALRLIRAVRIATQLGFFIEEKTFVAIQKNAFLIKAISSERVKDELFKILSSRFPYEGMMLLRNSGLLYHLLPELEKGFTTPQKSPKRHHRFDVGTHSLLSLKHCPSKDPIARLAALIHDIGKPATFAKDKDDIITFYNHEVIGASIAKKIAKRLKFSKKDQNRLFTLVRWHQFTVDDKQSDKAIRRFIKRVGKENLDDILAVRIGDRLGGGAAETSWRLEKFKKRLIQVQKQPFTITDLKVNGDDVMKMFECNPGPFVGKVLNQIFEEVVDKKIKNERKSLLTKLKELASQGPPLRG